jgi:hypothetical protein
MKKQGVFVFALEMDEGTLHRRSDVTRGKDLLVEPIPVEPILVDFPG